MNTYNFKNSQGHIRIINYYRSKCDFFANTPIKMAGVFDLELHDEPVEVDDSDDDVIEIEEVNIDLPLSRYYFET